MLYNDELIEKFKQTKFFKELLNNDEIILGMLGGSRGLLCPLEFSDYDLFFICKNKVTPLRYHLADYYFHYKGLTLHYSVSDFETFIKESKTKTNALGLIETCASFLIFYENEKYSKEISNIKTIFTDSLFKQYSLKWFNYFINPELLKASLEELKKTFKTTKSLYHLMVFCTLAHDKEWSAGIQTEIQKMRKFYFLQDSEITDQQLLSFQKYLKESCEKVNSFDSIEELKAELINKYNL